ncbi:ATPase domain-containing protein [Archangium lansingense]|uniref:non-specific serine/threonine protein kinase n=1 Tax=Archangium lansingense TaxID=2995310 RepID=A0ABT3ZY64_9BACT|nr:ATPase domain-containing protein [Archangium lansinium]MCY1073642.1 AAA family ATPase [Archangium lansinium]
MEGDVPRISSGTPYLDQLLAGGWLRGGSYIVTGPPGTGKTTLGNQFCFSVAEQGDCALYVTLLVETHARMLMHLRSLAFFRPEFVGTRVFYLSGTTVLKEKGPSGLLELLTRTVREKHIKVLVIDGFTLVRERAGSTLEQREFLQGLSVLCGLTDCTTLLLSTEMSKAMNVEYAMVDGILALNAELLGRRAIRDLEVVKFRGSNNIPGRHTFLINEHGICIYPRWEAVYRKIPEIIPESSMRLRFGVPRLDAMCQGGLVAYSSTLLLGSPGSGKTLLGLHFLAEGARNEEPGLYFGFAESGKTLMRRMKSMGLDLTPYLERGLIRLESRALAETLPDAMVQELMNLVSQHQYRRVFIDGLEPFAKEAIDPERTTRFLSALINALRDKHITPLITEETNTLFGPDIHSPIEGAEAIFDNLIFLRFVELNGRLYRLLSILKMRDSDNDPFLRELVISHKGIQVQEAPAALGGMMTGQSQAPKTRKKSPKRLTALKRHSRKPGGRK